MEWIETTGPTVDAAKEIAIDRLGVAMDQAEFEVVEVEKTNFFGRPKSPARVRARVLPKAPPRREDRRPRKARTNSDGRNNSEARNGDGSSRSDRAPKNSRKAAQTKSSNTAPAPQESASGTSSRAPRTSTNTVEVPQVSIEDMAGVGTSLLAGLVEAMGLQATVTAAISEDRLDFNVTGENLGLLVGRGGRTVEGIQEITRAVLLKSARGGADFRIGVDVAGHRSIREAALHDFGVEIAQRAVASGTEFAIDPMSSVDRKVLHDAVQSVTGAVSGSEGMGDSRRVVVRRG